MAILHPSDMSLADQLAAVHGWWHDAGVDFAFVDEPLAMLREPEVAAPPPKRVRAAVVEVKAPPPVPMVSTSDLPHDLAAFREWWCDPAAFLPQFPGKRIAPVGTVGARFMVVTPMPEGDDAAPSNGPQGRLIANMLGALGIEPGAAYFATALPLPIAMPDWDSLAAGGLGAVLAHHISIVRPQRVLLLGSPLARMLPGEPAIPTLATFAPDQLLAHPRQCAKLWPRLLDWMPPA